MHIRRDGGFIVLDMYQFERQYLNVPQLVWDRVPNNGNNPNPKNGGGVITKFPIVTEKLFLILRWSRDDAGAFSDCVQKFGTSRGIVVGSKT